MGVFQWFGRATGWLGMLGFLSAAAVWAAPEGDVPARLAYADVMAQEIESRILTMQLAGEDAETRSTPYPTQALINFYTQRQYRPAWDSRVALGELIFELEALAADGLNPDDYQVEQLRHALDLVGDESMESLAARVDDEFRATSAFLRALFHLFNGKVDSTGLEPQWNFGPGDLALTSIGLELVDISAAGSIRDLFAKTRPQHPAYRSLMAGLQRYRQWAATGGWPSLPAGPTLKPCMIDPQVAILRARLKVTGEYVDPGLSPEAVRIQVDECVAANASSAASSLPASSVSMNTDSSLGISSSSVFSADASESQAAFSSAAPVNPDEVFDKYLVEAVKQFQRDQYLEVDGAIGPATRAALNISAQARVDQIRVNLDRARWLLHNVPADMVLVDVAGFKVTYYKASQPIWRSRVQVGMSYRTSPIFKSEVNYITLNPTWTIPPTILRKDVLPKLRKDLSYLRDNKVRVLDSNGKELDPATIDWHKPGNVTLRQDAGPHAALGKAVIRFPNSHAVYLHDTPHQKLFNKSQRAFSSGCIRVERALELVELLLAETPGWDKAAINAALATGKTRNVTLAKRVPILLAYWTVDAISEDKLAFKPDIYARDAKVLAALDKGM